MSKETEILTTCISCQIKKIKGVMYLRCVSVTKSALNLSCTKVFGTHTYDGGD